MSDRGLRIALGVSLVVNVFVIGGVAGALYMQTQKPAAVAANPPLFRACANMASAPPNGFRTMLCAQLPTLRPIQQDSRKAKRQAMELLAAPTFDRAAAGAALDRARADDIKARAQIENAILDYAATLPADKRGHLVDALRGNARRRAMIRQGLPASD